MTHSDSMIAPTEQQIAWELADALNRHLTAEDRTLVYVNLGSAHYPSGIRRLLNIALSGQVRLAASTLDRLEIWCRISHREREYQPLLSRLRGLRGR
ncbi:hypothetical protein L2K20_01710 [Mycobacterium sp. MBM]|nr:hypothetical protein [Mycobacterium sp. MBM]